MARGVPHAAKNHAIASGENLGLRQWGLQDRVERRRGEEFVAKGATVGEGEEAGHPNTLFVDVGEGRDPKEQTAAPILADAIAPAEVRRRKAVEDVQQLLFAQDEVGALGEG